MEEITKENRMINRIQPEDDVIDLKEVFFVLLNGWKVILLALLLGAAAFGAYHTFLIKPSYQADATMYITNTDSVISFSDLQLSSALTDDYAKILKSRTVLNRVIDELQLEMNYKQLASLIRVENPDSTHILSLYVTCGDLELSRNIVNALLNIGIDQIYQIVGTNQPTVIDYSVAEAVQDVTPGIKKYILMGGMLGAVLACAVLVVRMLMNTTIRTEGDVEKYLQLPILAAVPYYTEKHEQR